MGHIPDYIERKGRIYYPTTYYIDKYKVSDNEMSVNRRKYELPYIKIGNRYYHAEEDFNDFYAGKIGKQ